MASTTQLVASGRKEIEQALDGVRENKAKLEAEEQHLQGILELMRARPGADGTPAAPAGAAPATTGSSSRSTSGRSRSRARTTRARSTTSRRSASSAKRSSGATGRSAASSAGSSSKSSASKSSSKPRRRTSRARSASAGGPAPSSDRVLQALSDGPKTREGLEQALGISATRVSQLTKPLVQAGQVKANADPSNPRGRHIFELASS